MISCIWAWACSTSSVGPSRLMRSSPSVNSIWTCTDKGKWPGLNKRNTNTNTHTPSPASLPLMSVTTSFQLVFCQFGVNPFLSLILLRDTHSAQKIQVQARWHWCDRKKDLCQVLFSTPVPSSPLPVEAAVWSVRCSVLSCRWWNDATRQEQ